MRTIRAPAALKGTGTSHFQAAALLHARTVWQENCRDEINFWDDWFRTKGLIWPTDYRDKIDPAFPLQDFYRGLVDAIPETDVTILDVGAGPLTIVGKVHPGKQVRIVAVDPLADEYDGLLERYNVVPAVRTQRCAAEELHQLFEDDTFDMVNATNCIDHSFDPVAAIQAMVRVLKPGRVLTMQHAENEANTQNYVGLHQWNLTIDGKDFWVRSQRGECNVTAVLAPVADVCCYKLASNNRIIANVRKHDMR